jgi:ATP-dependent helicase YprA (DUF1998 family)
MALNPIAFTENVVRSFLRYQLTTYPFADPELHAQMRRLLSLDETRLTPLVKGPYISLSRSFRSGASVAALAKEGVLHPTMESLVPFPGLYGHQERAIRAIHERRTTLVSTGTGSGKTEAFLYPIISRCLELRDRKAPAGIAAVLVYPMNALAEDQLLRLRDLLAGTGVTFGMYVGKTPEANADVAGPQLKTGASREDYRRRLKQEQAEGRGVAVHPAEERCSREAMRSAGGQPRILLTNVKQLELLLTRQTDATLFDGASLEYLVFDEAHTFSGAMGAETACLIRRLRGFCGRSAQDTVCIATSATIADPKHGPQAAQEFASRFFGVPAASVAVVQEEYEGQAWPDARVSVPPPARPADVLRLTLEVLGAETNGETGGRVAALASTLGLIDVRPGSWEADLYAALARTESVYQIAQALHRPRALTELLEDLAAALGRPVTVEEVLIWLALGAASRDGGRPLLRPVIHGFVSGVAGAAVTFPVGEPRARLWLSAEEAAREQDELARLAVQTCTTCGQHYYIHHVADFSFTEKAPGGGEQVGDRVVWRPLAAELSGKRVVLVDQVVGADDEDDDPAGTAPIALCRRCGALHPHPLERCDACGVEGPLVELLVLAQKDTAEGRLSRCLSCGSPGRPYAGRYREPARPVRAVNVADVHVLAQDMIRFTDRRRLLVFADNRQDAAFQAGWMRDHSRRFRLRALMAERIPEEGIRPGDLAARLDAALDADDELSRSLAPEVWNQHQKTGEPVQHAAERKYFLRIQVLREIATGVKQWIGLEPWGRMRVEYDGLNAGSDYVRALASRLQVEPALVAEGIAGLLDRARRSTHLLDRQSQLFSRYWSDGDREILRGYMPVISGVPKGLKLEREPQDDAQRVTQWLSKTDTSVRQAVRRWGVPKEDVADFVRELWDFLVKELKVLAPVTLQGSHGRALPKTSGTYQVDADRLLLRPHRGYWRCQRCRRSQPRPAPLDLCLSWRCDGKLAFVAEEPDNYDLSLLDAGVPMLRPREHTAQVPAADREFLENAFKGDSEIVNTIVFTSTLEMGVDIGALDTVLMRNVPPLPANYWQRAGRAGRRHRMAVNLTYVRNMSHDRAYFAQPERLLEGRIEPPRFNMRNELMVRKHVHSTVLTRLHRLTRPEHRLSETDREEIAQTLKAQFPSRITTYLFDDAGNVRQEVYDTRPLATIVSKHEADLLAHVREVFQDGWPEADLGAVSDEQLARCVRGMPDELNRVVSSLKKRLDWAREEMDRLNRLRTARAALEPDEDAVFQRCDRLIKRLKGQAQRQRREGEGVDDVSTFGVLAAEGFLPGYGLDIGSVTGTAIVPRQLSSVRDFELRRPTAMAVREFVPGNLIYANGQEFGARYYHLGLEATSQVVFDVDPANEAVAEVGAGLATLSASQLQAIPACDVDLPHMSHISDEEENRFQLSVSVYGYELGRHGGGRAYQWNDRELLLRRNVHLRLVNVGATFLVSSGTRLGYPVCLVCGQSRSVLASEKERTDFETKHRERCGQAVRPTGFYADVVADALSLECANREEAYSVLEALRIGATQVLDMDREDLELLVIGRPGSAEVTALLYDPMPGGSGLLDQLCERFGEVAKATSDLMEQCPSACERSCIDCMQTYRNAFFHRHLSRKVALEMLAANGLALTFSHDLPQRLPDSSPKGNEAPTNAAESRLQRMLQRAGLPEPKWQYTIDLGKALGTTRPDCFFPGEDPEDPGIAVYLDGLSSAIHGNPATAQRDREIRGALGSRGYEVLQIAVSELNDRKAMQSYFFRIGRALVGKEFARKLRDEPLWFEEGNEAPAAEAPEPALPFRVVEGRREERFKTCVPLLTLEAAAGLFSEAQRVDQVEGAEWVEPNTARALRPGMFVARVKGRSMEPRIPDGSFCLFAGPVEGGRNGRVVLVEHRKANDPDNGGRYTVKVYRSRKDERDDGTWAHAEIRLTPINREFPTLDLEAEDAESLRVVAEFVEVLR